MRRCVKLAVASPHHTRAAHPQGSKVAVFPSTVPYESLATGLVKEMTATPELAERLARLRPSSSHYRPSEVSLSEHLPSIKDSNFSFQTLSPAPTSPDCFVNTPALTIPVETLAPDDENEDPHSDGPESYCVASPHQNPTTSSPTVFSPDVAISCSFPISRSASQRTHTSSSFMSRITGGSKPCSVSQKVLAKFMSSRKSSKGSDRVIPTKLGGVEPSGNSSEDYPFIERQIPINFSGNQLEDHSYRDTPGELPFSPSNAAFSPNGLYTPSEHQFIRYTPSERSFIIGTPRRSSLKNSHSKLSRSLRNNSSRVSFKNLSPSSGGPFHSPETATGKPLPDDLNHIQLGSPNFVSQPSENSIGPSPHSESTPYLSPPSPVHVVPVVLPRKSIDKVVNQLGSQFTATANTAGPFRVVNPAELVTSPTVYPTEYGSPAVTTIPPSSRHQSFWNYSTSTAAPTSRPEIFRVPELSENTGPKAATPASLPPPAQNQAESRVSGAFPQDQSKKAAAAGLFGAPTPYTRTSVLPSPHLTVASSSPPSPSATSVRSPHRTPRPVKSDLRKRSTSSVPRSDRPTESILFPRPKEDDARASQASNTSPTPNYSFPELANRPLPAFVFSATTSPTEAFPIRLPDSDPEHVPLPPSSFTATPADPAFVPLPPSVFSTAPPSASSSPEHSRLGSRANSRIGSRFPSRRSSRRNIVTRLPSIASSGKVQSAIFESQEPAQDLDGPAFSTPPAFLPNDLASSPSKTLLSSPGSVTPQRSSIFKSFSRPNSRTPSIKALKSSLTALLGSKRNSPKNASQATLPLEASPPTQGSVHKPFQEPTRFLNTEEPKFTEQDVPFSVKKGSASNQTTAKPSRKSSFTTLLRFTPSKKTSNTQLTRTLSEPLLSQQPTPKSRVYREPPPLGSPQSQLSRQSSHPRLSRKSSHHQIFTPSLRPSAHLAPNELTAFPDEVIEHLPPEVIANMPMNGNIDNFEGFDYQGYNWFQNPPPKAEPAAPATISPPYVPMPGVIEQNEAFIHAVQAAPNVLYSQYKQYGQLGVLAWCADFDELIEAMKQLGYEGDMFVKTRSQALAACQEILKLKLDIKLQIIIIYLSSQVARLRRFLDGETEYDDYPVY